MKRLISLAISLFASMFIALSASAQVKDKKIGDWTVYTTDLQGKKTCYIASFPKNKSGNYSKRDEPYLLVTRISNSVNEVSTSSGYKYKANSEVKVDIDGNNYKLFTSGEVAWAYDKAQDDKIISAMRRGNKMKVRGTSLKGTYSIDTYSLSGITAAFKRMHEICK